ncbi:MAG: hypothetical protein QXL94_00460 [Candidatus Parvarchaeum sp.]
MVTSLQTHLMAVDKNVQGSHQLPHVDSVMYNEHLPWALMARFIAYVPPNFTTYIDPYCSNGISLYLPRPYTVSAISHPHPYMRQFYQLVKDNPEALWEAYYRLVQKKQEIYSTTEITIQIAALLKENLLYYRNKEMDTLSALQVRNNIFNLSKTLQPVKLINNIKKEVITYGTFLLSDLAGVATAYVLRNCSRKSPSFRESSKEERISTRIDDEVWGLTYKKYTPSPRKTPRVARSEDQGAPEKRTWVRGSRRPNKTVVQNPPHKLKQFNRLTGDKTYGEIGEELHADYERYSTQGARWVAFCPDNEVADELLKARRMKHRTYETIIMPVYDQKSDSVVLRPELVISSK